MTRFPTLLPPIVRAFSACVVTSTSTLSTAASLRAYCLHFSLSFEQFDSDSLSFSLSLSLSFFLSISLSLSLTHRLVMCTSRSPFLAQRLFRRRAAASEEECLAELERVAAPVLERPHIEPWWLVRLSYVTNSDVTVRTSSPLGSSATETVELKLLSPISALIIN